MSQNIRTILFILGLILSYNLLAQIDSGINNNHRLRLPPLFTDHTVLQQKTKAAIWGKAAPNSEILITATWGKKAKTISDNKGNFETHIKTPIAGGPYQIVISNNQEKITLNDVLIGEVWLCSGQSNMEMPLRGDLPKEPIVGSKEAIQSANYPNIRMFTLKHNVDTLPQEHMEGEWSICSPETAGDFSAVAFFFGRKLHQNLDIPIGLIHSSWGGTPAESWTPVDELKKVSGFEHVEENLNELNNQFSQYNVWMNQLEKRDAKIFFEDYEELINPEYSDENYDDSHWDSMEIPTWLEGELKTFDGIIWFRKSFELSNVDEKATYMLSLGGIDDEDITFVNGKRVGMTRDWTVSRNYPLPKALLKNGTNNIAVRLFDGASNGGMYGEKHIGIEKDDQSLQDLSGDWKYLPSAIFINRKFFFYTDDKKFKSMPVPPLAFNSQLPTGLYNAMIHPLIPFSIKGAIWYQGENNVSRAEQYQSLFPAMIQSWRNKWGKEFPFYFTQLAPYTYSGKDSVESAELRNVQNKTLSLPKTGQAVTLDIGSFETIHPPHKEEVGERLARWALAKDYNQKSVAFSGPVCTSAKFNGDIILLDFMIGSTSLVSGEFGLKEFELEYENGSVNEVSASIRGNQIVLDNPTGQLPKAVRYAWKNGSEASLFNSAGLPASTFYIEFK
ncbi:MAG: sialate O-acetylesterase [Flavobacteriales bacterium]|jgi:sialate O-acetylesterase